MAIVGRMASTARLIDEARALLAEEDEVIAVGPGALNLPGRTMGQFGILIATSAELVFYGRRAPGGVTLHRFPYEDITSISFEWRLSDIDTDTNEDAAAGVVAFVVSGFPLSFEQMPAPTEGRAIVDTVKRQQARESAAQDASRSEVDAFHLMQALRLLHDADLLAEEQVSALRAEILRRF